MDSTTTIPLKQVTADPDEQAQADARASAMVDQAAADLREAAAELDRLRADEERARERVTEARRAQKRARNELDNAKGGPGGATWKLLTDEDREAHRAEYEQLRKDSAKATSQRKEAEDSRREISARLEDVGRRHDDARRAHQDAERVAAMIREAPLRRAQDAWRDAQRQARRLGPPSDPSRDLVALLDRLTDLARYEGARRHLTALAAELETWATYVGDDDLARLCRDVAGS